LSHHATEGSHSDENKSCVEVDLPSANAFSCNFNHYSMVKITVQKTKAVMNSGGRSDRTVKTKQSGFSKAIVNKKRIPPLLMIGIRFRM
jgi:hypothetical protein